MMKILRRLFLLPALVLLSCDDREASSALPTAPEAALGFRLKAADSLPTVDSVRIRVTGGGVDEDTVLPWAAKRGGIKALPVGVKYTATLEGLKLVNGRKVVAWSATDTVTLNDSKDRKVLDMAPVVRTLQPLVKSDFAALALFAGEGDTLVYGLSGDTATLTVPSGDAADSVYVGEVAVPLSGRSFVFKLGLDTLPSVTVVARDGMSRTWVLAPKALREPLQLAVDAGRTLRVSGAVLVDSMDYVVPADRSPLTIAGVTSLRRNGTAVEVRKDTARVVLLVPPAGASRMDTLVGSDRLGRKDTILIRSVRATDTLAPKVGFSVSPSQSIVAGASVAVSVTFTVQEDSLLGFQADGVVRGADSSVFVVEKTLDATAGWSLPWEAVDRSGGKSSGMVVVSRYDADIKDTVPPTLDSMSLDVASWKAGGKTWIKGGDATLKVFAKDDRGASEGVAGIWLFGRTADGIRDSLPLAKGNGFWSAGVKVARDTLLDLVARDQAGNPSVAFSAAVRVDAQAPVILVKDSLLSGAGAVKIDFSLQETGVGLLADNLVLLVDGKTSTLPVTNAGENYSIEFPGTSASGRHVLGFRACDRLLNCATDSTVVRIDADGPTITGLQSPVVADSNGGRRGVLTVRDPAGVMGVNAVYGTSSFEAVKDGEDWLLQISSIPEGDATWSLVATDSLGNVNSVPFTTYRVPAPVATAVGQVASGTTVTLSCQKGRINLDGTTQDGPSSSLQISQSLTMPAYCVEDIGRSSSKSFAWTVAALANSTLVSVGDSVADSTGKLDLVVTVENAASINTAELQPNSSGTTLATVKGTVNVQNNTVTFSFTNMAEGVASYLIVVQDKDNDAWSQKVSLRRVSAPTKGASPSASIGEATIQCAYPNDTLYLDGVSKRSYMATPLITTNVSYAGRCVDAKGHSSRTVTLKYELAAATDSLLLLDGNKLSTETHLVAVMADSLGKAPRLVVGDKKAGVVYAFALDPRNPWKNYLTSEAKEKWGVADLDTLLVAKGHGTDGSRWLVMHSKTVGVQMVPLTSGGFGTRTQMSTTDVNGTKTTGANLTGLMAVALKRVVFLLGTPGADASKVPEHYTFDISTDAWDPNKSYAENFSNVITTKFTRMSDLGLSLSGPVISWVDGDGAGMVKALELTSNPSEAVGEYAESFTEGPSGAGTKGWQLLYPQPNREGAWSLTPRNVAYGSDGAVIQFAPLFTGTITATARPAMAFGASQGWLALPGGHLWRFNLDGKEVEKGVYASKVAELAPTAVSSGMVDGYGHAWFSHARTDDAWLLLRASP